MNKEKIVEDYLKHLPKDIGSRTVARRLCQDYPLYFTTIDQARTIVRIVRGTHGIKERERRIRAGKGHLFKTEYTAPPEKKVVPEPIVDNEEAFYLILSDPHAPYHDKRALETAVNKGRELGCDALYLNGDTADNYDFSKWFKKPIHQTPKQDLDVVRTILKDLNTFWEKKYFKIGNHDERFEKYCDEKAPALASLGIVSFSDALGLDYYEYDVVESMQFAFLGKCPILHGHEMGRSIFSPVNPARGAWLRIKDTVVVGHMHKPSTHVEPVGLYPHKKNVVTRSLGCLCSLTPDYQSASNWSHGFATLKVHKDGSYDFNNYLINHNYKVITV